MIAPGSGNYLWAANANVIPAGNVVSVGSGASFGLSANQTIAGLTGSGLTFVFSGASATLTLSPSAGQSNTYAGSFDPNGGTGVMALAMNGAGTQILTGANTYTGGTTVSGGTLQIGNGGTAGSPGTGGLTVNGGVLAFNRSDNPSFAGAVNAGASGGTISQQSAAGVTLTDNVTLGGNLTLLAAAGGTLNIGATANGNQITFNGNTLTVGGGGATVLNAWGNAQAGALVKTGSGLLVTTGNPRLYDSNVFVSGGTLSVQGVQLFSAANCDVGGIFVQSQGVLELQNWAYGATYNLGGLRDNPDAITVNNGTIRMSNAAPDLRSALFHHRQRRRHARGQRRRELVDHRKQCRQSDQQRCQRPDHPDRQRLRGDRRCHSRSRRHRHADQDRLRRLDPWRGQHLHRPDDGVRRHAAARRCPRRWAAAA